MKTVPQRLTHALAGVAMAIMAAGSGQAADLTVDHGNIALDGKALTSGGSDSDPVLSPDGKTVAFVRLGADSDAMAGCSSQGATPVRSVSLWTVRADGTGAAKALDAHPGSKPETTVCEFDKKAFDATGRYLYFDTPAWPTQSGVHVLDLKTGRDRFFEPGSLVRVVSACGNKKYLNTVVVAQQRSFVLGGSYEWPYLFTSGGKEIGPVSDDSSKLDALDSACAAPPAAAKS